MHYTRPKPIPTHPLKYCIVESRERYLQDKFWKIKDLSRIENWENKTNITKTKGQSKNQVQETGNLKIFRKHKSGKNAAVAETATKL